MAELITDPQAAKVELSLDDPCSRREVMAYVQNYHKSNLHPMFLDITRRIEAQIKQQNMGGIVVNNLIDFLEQRGLRQSADGRFYLNPQEFQKFCIDRAEQARGEARRAADA